MCFFSFSLPVTCFLLLSCTWRRENFQPITVVGHRRSGVQVFWGFFINNNKTILIISSSVVSSSLPDFQTLWTKTTGRSTSRRPTWPSVWWRRATTPRGSPSRMSLRSQVRVAAARHPPDCLLSFDLNHSKKKIRFCFFRKKLLKELHFKGTVHRKAVQSSPSAVSPSDSVAVGVSVCA